MGMPAKRDQMWKGSVLAQGFIVSERPAAFFANGGCGSWVKAGPESCGKKERDRSSAPGGTERLPAHKPMPADTDLQHSTPSLS